MPQVEPPFGIATLRLFPDERLVRRAVAGDRRAFAAIYRRYQQDLYRFSLAIVRDPEDAADALQSTMVKAMRALPGEERQIQLKPWLYRIAHNESVELLRRRRAYVPDSDVPTLAPGPHEEAERRARLRALLADLDDLPERQRGALLMREMSGLGLDEIAAALDASPAVVRQTIYEARNSLRQMESGREMGCESVARAISEADGRVARRRDLRAHLRECPSCRRFRDEMGRRQADLAAVGMPALGIAGAIKGLIGVKGAASGVAGAVGEGVGPAVGVSVIAKSAATVAVVAAIGVSVADRGAPLGGGLPDGADGAAPSGGPVAPGAPAGALATARRPEPGAAAARRRHDGPRAGGPIPADSADPDRTGGRGGRVPSGVTVVAPPFPESGPVTGAGRGPGASQPQPPQVANPTPSTAPNAGSEAPAVPADPDPHHGVPPEPGREPDPGRGEPPAEAPGPEIASEANGGGQAPGHGGTPPGHGGTSPGRSGAPPGAAKGHSKDSGPPDPSAAPALGMP
jgi:RNA polymerase sigma factor (sigma-70 family)